ncbi:MAG: GGDEF domain-containing protein [Proteobacteria bacterium]|nr:GGDEF domain-containing protein [Pseudomonadota bacterium]
MADLSFEALRDSLLRLVGRTEPDHEEPARERRARPRAISVPADGEDPMLSKLALLLRSRGSVVSGKVHFVNLDVIRQNFGNRWPAARERVFNAASRIIATHMGPTDMFSQVGDESFVIIFAGLSKPEARLKCGLIADEIYKHLLGEDRSFTDINISTVVAAVDGSISFESVNLKSILDAALGAAEGLDDAAAPADAPAVSDRTTALEDTQTAPAVNLLPTDLHFVYLPMWDAQRKAISTFACMPRSSQRLGVPLTDYAVLPGEYSSSFVPDLDLKALDRVTADAAAYLAAGGKAFFAVTVHWRTLETFATRERYRALCDKIPEKLRKLMVFEIVGLPYGAPESRVVGLVGALKPFSRSIFMRSWISDIRAGATAYFGITGISVYFGDITLPEKDLIRPLEKMCEAAGRLSLKTAAHGIRSKSLTLIAIGAGFNFIDGEAVTSALDKPGTMIRFDIEDLYT